MRTTVSSALVLVVLFQLCEGSTLSSVHSHCGDWIPYKNEKCVKFIEHSALQTKENGEIICKSFSDEINGEEIPKLVTIKTEEKQIFLEKLLFEHLNILKNVWLGSEMGEDNVTRWNDGTELVFTNWASGMETDQEHRCAQLDSGDGAYGKGKWVKANCKKKNHVICERSQPRKNHVIRKRSQPRNLVTSQDIILNFKLKVARNNQEWEEKLNKSNQKLDTINHVVQNLKQNPVPVGFLYVELPGQLPPATLWPHTSWKDVSSNYAGLFFRVVGGAAGSFGEIQKDQTRRIDSVETQYTYEDIKSQIPEDGNWSKFSWSGTNATGTRIGVRAYLTKGEIRPRNQAVRLWQRIQNDCRNLEFF